jgi:hypothetical protein
VDFDREKRIRWNDVRDTTLSITQMRGDANPSGAADQPSAT